MYGYGREKGMPFVDQSILFSTANFQVSPVKLAASARDANNPSGTTTDLRAGLVLGRGDGSGSLEQGAYKEFDSTANDGTEKSKDVAVLAHNVTNIDSEGPMEVSVFYEGQLKKSKLKGDVNNVNWAEVQRLTVREV